MNFILRIICFYLAFTVNVQIKAEAVLLEEPKGCWEKVGVCAIKSVSSPDSLTTAAAQVDFSQGSIWRRSSEKYIRLIKGYFFIRATAPLNVSTKYASIQLEAKQAVFVDLKFDRVEVTAFQGNLKIKDLLDENYLLPQSYANWFGKVQRNSSVEVGFPRPANFKQLIAKVGVITSLDQRELYKSLEVFRETWVEAINETQARSIASSEKVIRDWNESLRRQAERRRLRALERKRMRKFFYRKTFLE